MSRETVIVGSGVSALMLARMIRAYKDPKAKIILIEKEAAVGGQFGSVDYGAHGLFDYGMHIYYESCVPEIDRLFTSLLPEKDWCILAGNEKDIAGIYHNGRLQTDTPFVDLRRYPEDQRRIYVGDLFNNIQRTHGKTLNNDANAFEILSWHFGPLIAEEIYVPLLKKLYLRHASELDEIATQLTALHRIAAFEPGLMKDLMLSAEVRSRIAYPDQLNLPPYRTNDQKGFYPRQYGMNRVLQNFRETLEREGCEFMTSTSITGMSTANGNIESIRLKRESEDIELKDPVKVYWTAGLPPLALALKIDLKGMTNDRREPASYVNFLFDKAPSMDRLYYFYCFEPGFRTFRVTNYSNYCPTANNGRGFPLCVEYWPVEGDLTQDDKVVQTCIDELKAFGVIDGSYRTLLAKVEKVHGGGFPLPTIKNIGNMNSIRTKIQEAGIKNLVPVGVLAEKNVFFIKDVLLDAYRKVQTA